MEEAVVRSFEIVLPLVDDVEPFPRQVDLIADSPAGWVRQVHVVFSEREPCDPRSVSLGSFELWEDPRVLPVVLLEFVAVVGVRVFFFRSLAREEVPSCAIELWPWWSVFVH